MNNRFKFRICHESNGHKTIIYPPTNTFMIGLDGKVYENYKKRNDHGAIDNLWEEVFDADNVIIQQFTGLTDKNGKEVYEGDIVKIKRWYLRPFINNKQEIDYQHIEGDTEVGQVIWGWNSQKFLVSYEHIRYDDSEDFDKSSHSVEVIGNISENPELLK